MSKVQLQGNASGTGIFTIASPNSNTDRTLTLPDNTGTILTSASSISQNSGPAFGAQISTVQTISANANTKVVFGTEIFDTNSAYDTATGRFQPQVAGYYEIHSQIYFPATSSSYATNEIQKNGTVIAVSATASQSYVAACPNTSAIVYMNGSSDYIEIYAATGQSGTINLTASSRFFGALIRTA
jgi:hypothetical protein